jgi:hypothetical protein
MGVFFGSRDDGGAFGHWLGREGWEKLTCIGAVNARCTSEKGTSGVITSVVAV